MRVLFCGSGTFAVPSLQAIVQTEHELVGLLTQPARRAGRGGKLRRTPISIAAEELGLEPTECENINDPEMVEFIRSSEPDVICVIDFGQKVRQAARDCARLDTINLHGSLLPLLRGAAPINWAIIRGYENTGATTFSLVDEMDAGQMLGSVQIPIHSNETTIELKERTAEVGAVLVCETLGQLAAGWADRVKQDEEWVTYAPKLSKADGILDWTANADIIRNHIHGCWPWPGGQTTFVRQDGHECHVVIARAKIVDGDAQDAPGVFDEDKYVSTGDGRLEILEIKPAGKRLMDFKAFANGQHLKAGDSFVRKSEQA